MDLATITGVFWSNRGNATGEPLANARILFEPRALDEVNNLVDSKSPVRAKTDNTGHIVGLRGEPIKLWPGVWRVTLPDLEIFEISVESGHTYDLVQLRGPGTSPQYVTVQPVYLPPTPDGWLFSRDGNKIVGVDPNTLVIDVPEVDLTPVNAKIETINNNISAINNKIEGPNSKLEQLATATQLQKTQLDAVVTNETLQSNRLSILETWKAEVESTETDYTSMNQILLGKPAPLPDGWTQVFFNDFDVDAPLGDFTHNHDPMDWALDESSVYHGILKTAGSDYTYSTSGPNGAYSSEDTVSVSDGALKVYMHQRADGKYVSTNVQFDLGWDDYPNGMTRCQGTRVTGSVIFETRIRVSGAGGWGYAQTVMPEPGYHVGPELASWPLIGEANHVETNGNEYWKAQSWHHGPGSGIGAEHDDNKTHFNGTGYMSSWRVMSTEVLGSVQAGGAHTIYRADGFQIAQFTGLQSLLPRPDVARSEMTCAVQCGLSDGTQRPTGPALLEIDWVRIAVRTEAPA